VRCELRGEKQPALRWAGGWVAEDGGRMPLPERFSLARILKSYFLNFALSEYPIVDLKDYQSLMVTPANIRS
jgi:hypothetical protein